MKIPKLKLAGRMMLYVMGAIVLMASIIFTVIGVRTMNQSQNAAFHLSMSESQKVALNVELYLNQAIDALNTLSSTYTALISSKNPNREDATAIMLENLKQNKSYAAVWQMWNKNAFDNRDSYFAKQSMYNQCEGMLNFTYYRNGSEYVSEKGTIDQYSQDYYTIPKTKGELTIVEPYMYTYTGKTNDSIYETSIVAPIKKQEQIIAVVAVDIELDALKKIVSSDTLYKTGFSVIISNNLQIAAHPDNTLRGKKLSSIIKTDYDKIQSIIQSGKSYYTIDTSLKTKQEVLRCFAPIKIKGSSTPWSVMVEIPMSEVLEEAHDTLLFVILIGVISMLFITILIFIIARSISKPIRQSVVMVQSVAAGNLQNSIALSDRDDEIGEITNAQHAMVEKLHNVMTAILEMANEIHGASKKLHAASQDLSLSTNIQASSIEEVSASMEQIVSSIEQNATNSKQTEQIAQQASKEILESAQSIGSTIDAMKIIIEKISIISVIAERTDLLAINAAIEAARAGEAGKGFAVVAGEIRRLAEQSQNAAKEINALSRKVALSADESGTALQNLTPAIQKTARLVQEISTASFEQNAGTSQINIAISQLSSVTQSNASSADILANSADALSFQAELLKDLIAFFKIK